MAARRVKLASAAGKCPPASRSGVDPRSSRCGASTPGQTMSSSSTSRSSACASNRSPISSRARVLNWGRPGRAPPGRVPWPRPRCRTGKARSICGTTPQTIVTFSARADAAVPISAASSRRHNQGPHAVDPPVHPLWLLDTGPCANKRTCTAARSIRATRFPGSITDHSMRPAPDHPCPPRLRPLPRMGSDRHGAAGRGISRLARAIAAQEELNARPAARRRREPRRKPIRRRRGSTRTSGTSRRRASRCRPCAKPGSTPTPGGRGSPAARTGPASSSTRYARSIVRSPWSPSSRRRPPTAWRRMRPTLRLNKLRRLRDRMQETVDLYRQSAVAIAGQLDTLNQTAGVAAGPGPPGRGRRIEPSSTPTRVRGLCGSSSSEPGVRA